MNTLIAILEDPLTNFSKSIRTTGTEEKSDRLGKRITQCFEYCYVLLETFDITNMLSTCIVTLFRPQKWELIDPLTGRNVEPVKTPSVQNPRQEIIENRPQDTLLGQFFQKQTRNERFQPGPELAPQREAVENQHQEIGIHYY